MLHSCACCLSNEEEKGSCLLTRTLAKAEETVNFRRSGSGRSGLSTIVGKMRRKDTVDGVAEGIPRARARQSTPQRRDRSTVEVEAYVVVVGSGRALPQLDFHVRRVGWPVANAPETVGERQRPYCVLK